MDGFITDTAIIHLGGFVVFTALILWLRYQNKKSQKQLQRLQHDCQQKIKNILGGRCPLEEDG